MNERIMLQQFNMELLGSEQSKWPLNCFLLSYEDGLWQTIMHTILHQPDFHLPFEGLCDVFTVQPANVASLLYRTTNFLHRLVKEEQPKLTAQSMPPLQMTLSSIMRLLAWSVPPILAQNSDLVNKILFSRGPLDTSELYQGPRRISHAASPPHGEEGQPPVVDHVVLRCPGRWERNGCVAECLVTLLCESLFLENCTIPPKSERHPHVIWYV